MGKDLKNIEDMARSIREKIQGLEKHIKFYRNRNSLEKKVKETIEFHIMAYEADINKRQEVKLGGGSVRNLFTEKEVLENTLNALEDLKKDLYKTLEEGSE